ncbi:MAG: MGH1-like glycoside hydrolase domain-containing protein, partial [Flavisolibacter sp.]
MTEEQKRLQDKAWKKWGPYLTDRQWGTVREDYSVDGNVWEYTTHEMARSKAYRWGEEGIGGICDEKQLLCFALSMWNGQDPIIKERFFGLSNHEGNHGEDVKELYYYLDATPSHSYMRMLYKYPQRAFPYEWLVKENKSRSRDEQEFEILDTGIFDEDKYFDVFVEYAKESPGDLLVRIQIYNRGREAAKIHLLPTLWFRNTWVWGYDDYIPQLMASNNGNILVQHRKLENLVCHVERKVPLLFCNNETNHEKLNGNPNLSSFTKDGINDYLVQGNEKAVSTDREGTKVAAHYEFNLGPGETETIRLRLESENNPQPFEDFDDIFALRIKEADAFYGELQQEISSEDEKLVQRQAFAGMLWNKQLYYYDVPQWLNGDPAQVPPPNQRKEGRNHDWIHLNNADIISMPDKWEYPWYAAWDLAFHCIPLALVDAEFAKQQLLLLTKEWYMQPNGQLPAYEWNFGDVNPPVHAWSAWRVYQIDQKNKGGQGDLHFLEAVFH